MFPHTFNNALPEKMFVGLYDCIDPRKNGYTLNNRTFGEYNPNDTVSWSISNNERNEIVLVNAATYLQYKLNNHYHKFTGVRADFKLCRVFTNGQTSNQATAFHTDAREPFTYTIVLFSELNWNVSYGGEFVCRDPDGRYHYTTYIPNNAVVIPASWEHRGTPPNRLTERLRTSIAFTYEDPNCHFDQPLL